MKKMEYKKTVLAVTGILMIVLLALFMPVFLNDFTEKRDVSKIYYNDESAYEISTDKAKSTVEKLKILDEIFRNKREAQIIKVSFKPSKKKEQEIKTKISTELKKWVSMEQQLLSFKELEINLSGEVYYNNIELYTIYDTSISYYVCDLVVVSEALGQKYQVKLYIDSDDYKIYLMQTVDIEITEWVYDYWSGDHSAKWLLVEANMLQYLAGYYGIENVNDIQRNKNGIYGVYLNSSVSWNVGESYLDDEIGIQFGIGEFETFTYWDNEFSMSYVDGE